MKALIFNNRIVQVALDSFPVAPELEWFDCPDDCTTAWTFEEGEFYQPIARPFPSDKELKDSNVALAKSLLLESDWTQGRDVQLVNDNLWVAYRKALMVIIRQPQADSVFPVMPAEQWII